MQNPESNRIEITKLTVSPLCRIWENVKTHKERDRKQLTLSRASSMNSNETKEGERERECVCVCERERERKVLFFAFTRH